MMGSRSIAAGKRFSRPAGCLSLPQDAAESNGCCRMAKARCSSNLRRSVGRETKPARGRKVEDVLIARQNNILEIARQAGRVNVEELAARFEVTPQTIRKDLNELCDKRMLTRIHGGAILSSGV